MERYTDVFARTLDNDNRMCMAGILAAEHTELPAKVRAEVVRFGEMNVDWIARVLSAGSSEADETVARRALAIFSAVQGAQLIARSRGDIGIYHEVIGMCRKSGLLP